MNHFRNYELMQWKEDLTQSKLFVLLLLVNRFCAMQELNTTGCLVLVIIVGSAFWRELDRVQELNYSLLCNITSRTRYGWNLLYRILYSSTAVAIYCNMF